MCRGRYRTGALALACAAAMTGALTLSGAEEQGRGKAAFDYILWDGHRFARTAEEHERDVRYFRDLGFTHTFIGNADEDSPRDADRLRTLSELCRKYGMVMGLKFGSCGCVIKNVDKFAEKLGVTKQELLDRGMLLDEDSTNPMHPDIIKYYAEGYARTVAFCRQNDPGKCLKLFLLGSEFTWDLPKKPVPGYAKALEIIFRAAREDGVLKPDQPDDLGAIGYWWSGPHEKGRDWRLRKAIEDEILKLVPDADFMIDPIWAIKIVHGFGGTWTYIDDDPKRIACATLRLKAMTRPAPAAHSTQLIRGAAQDTLLEANLLAICMGADKLYHWGINTFEPGRELAPGYGNKTLKPTPQGFPMLREDQILNWPDLTKSLHDGRDAEPIASLWRALDKNLRSQLEETIESLVLDNAEPSRAIKAHLIEALNAAICKAGLFSDEAVAKLKLSARTAELVARQKRGVLSPEDLAEMNRLIMEAIFPDAVAQTPTPNIRALREEVLHKRSEKEPAIRSTGRLLRDRGEVFRDWKPMEPRLALLGGVYSDTELYLALIVGHIPFDILRNDRDRRERLGSYKFAACLKEGVPPPDYDDLLVIEKAGGTVLVPDDLKPPHGKPSLQRPVLWKPIEGKLSGDPQHQRRQLHKWAAELRELFHKAGLLPYFDSDNLDIVMQGYVYRGHPVLFVVNDKRGRSDANSSSEDKGLPNPVDILVRDTSDGLRVLDLDTGQDAKILRKDDGWHILDTLEPAWYKMYAVLKKGENWEGPAPLPPGPEVKNLSAARDADGGAVRLTWQLPIEDWVGCDVARYRVYRAEGEQEPTLLADIPGRIFTGPGGLVNSYVDTTAERGKAYAYRVCTVTPLRREGPLCTAARVEGK